MGIKLKSSKKSRLSFTLLQNVFNLISLILVIFLAVNIYSTVKESSILIIAIIFLIYFNIILFINIMLSNFRTISLWKIINEIILDVESKNNAIDIIHKRYVSSMDIMGKEYSNVIQGINEIISKIKTSIKNTDKNENMNIELVKNLTKKLDKPLNKIMENVKLLKHNANNVSSVKVLRENGCSLKSLIDELFEVSKLSSGDIEIELQEIEIVAFIKQALIEFRDEAEREHINLKVKLPEEKIFIKANGEKLWRVFEILIENTIKHSLENSRVYFEVYEKDYSVFISIKNISKRELNIKAHELVEIISLNQDDNTSGLGLEIAKNLVVIQGGNINLDIEADLFKTLISFDTVSLDKSKVV